MDSFIPNHNCLSSTAQQSYHAHKSMPRPCSPIFLQPLDSFMCFTLTYCAYTHMHAHKCTHIYIHNTSICIVHTHACTHMRIHAHTNTMQYNVFSVIIIPYLHDIFTVLPSEMKIQRHKIVIECRFLQKF